VTVDPVIGCSEAIRHLWEFLDQGLARDDQQAVEEHLAFCRRCCGELEFARELRRRLQATGAGGLPGDVAERLGRVIDDLGAGEPGGRRDVSGDMMFQDEIRDQVRSAYRAIPTGAGRAMAERLYSSTELDSVPERAIEWALGVGNPVRHAALSAGEVVLDIGCGGGIDTVLAARRVGPGGRVIGLDMLPEMCDRARAAAADAGAAAWCKLRRGEMEDIPLDRASIDVVISNGVINLSPRKSRALAEIARVLKPGGRLCISDLTVEDDLPTEVLTSDAAWAGCISGALSERVFTKMLGYAGLVDVEMTDRVPFGIDDVALYPLFTPEVLKLMRRLIADERKDRVAVGLIVRASRPSV
jgi:arsenite methyltransferase